MNAMDKVVVTSRSFSVHPVLRKELLDRYPGAVFNETGRQLSAEELRVVLADATKAITALETVDDALLASAPRLRVLAKYGVGLDMIDLEALSRRGVMLGWQGGVNRLAVAELALTFMLSLVRKVAHSNALVRAGGWTQVKGRQLSGKTVGIVGVGNVGRELVRLLAPFQCEILGHDIAVDAPFFKAQGVQAVDLPTLLEKSDIVSLHVPLTHATRGLIDAQAIARMKPGSVLVNTARGHLVCESSLKDALRTGHLAGAGFDVFGVEPPGDLELLRLDGFLATPHIGGSSEEAILAMGRAAIRGLDEFRDAREFHAYK